jgi:hypothetical protein
MDKATKTWPDLEPVNNQPKIRKQALLKHISSVPRVTEKKSPGSFGGWFHPSTFI